MLRTVYYPAIRRGVSRPLGLVLVFFLSAVFHELLVGLPLHMVRAWAFLGIMFQVGGECLGKWVGSYTPFRRNGASIDHRPGMQGRGCPIEWRFFWLPTSRDRSPGHINPGSISCAHQLAQAADSERAAWKHHLLGECTGLSAFSERHGADTPAVSLCRSRFASWASRCLSCSTITIMCFSAEAGPWESLSERSYSLHVAVCLFPSRCFACADMLSCCTPCRP